MSEANAETLVRELSAQRMEAVRAGFEADLQAAWEKGHERGRAEGVGEGASRV